MVFNKLIDSIPTSCKKVLSIDINDDEVIKALSNGRELFCLYTCDMRDNENLGFANVCFQKLGKGELPFENGEFDLVLGEEIFSRSVALMKAVNEIRRVLKNNGLLISVEPNIQYVGYLLDLVEGKWEKVLREISSEQCHYFFTKKSFLKLMSENRFNVEAFYPIEIDTSGNFPFCPEKFIVKDRYLIGPITESEYMEFLTRRFIVLLSKSE